MKVKVLTRNPDVYLRETKRDIHKLPRNYDPTLHPFEVQREYVKALNATKLERVFAKPFVGNLGGHRDGISCAAKHPKRLSLLLSGAYDGEVKLWDLCMQQCVQSLRAHEGYVRGVAFLPDGEHYLSIGDDKTIKLWETEPSMKGQVEPTDTVYSKTIVTAISHHQTEPLFATVGEVCQIWEETRSEPVGSFKWGVDSLHHVAYNPVETNLLAACASDRSVILYDTRQIGPVRRVVLKLRVNQLAWNPMEAYMFTCASEDYNLYSFDSRKLNIPLNIHMDHTSAVTCVDYAPTGREFVSGSYDKSLRIYEKHKGHSREIYHTKRMQRLTTVTWTLDNKFVVSGSDDMNLRLWKANASEKLGIVTARERAHLKHCEALKAKFAAHPQVARIQRHRQVPKHIYNARNEHRVAKNKAKRKEANVRKHSKPGSVPFVSERKKHVISEQE